VCARGSNRAPLGGPSTHPLGDGELAWWSLKRCAPYLPLLLLVACAKEPPPQASSSQSTASARSEPLEQPVIRASELTLKGVTTVAAVTGVVHITRKDAILNPVVGDPIQSGDLLQITTDSSITLSASGALITLTNRDGEWFKFTQ
jgi:hypothetical protein